MSAPLTVEQKTIHFLDRTSFGVTPESVQRVSRIGMSAYLDEQLQPEKIFDDVVEEKVSALKTIRLNSGELFDLYPPPKVAKERGMATDMMKAPRMIIYELQQARLLRAVQSQRQLNELMVDFWNNHLNITSPFDGGYDVRGPYDVNTIRKNALGKFSDMLIASARDPAMMRYLDNTSSDKRNVNENYGRELLELHTVGIDGGYNENDVRNSAYLMTGRPAARDGTFQYDQNKHWTGAVKVLGFQHANKSAKDGLAVGDV